MALADMRAAGLPELLTRTLRGPVSRESLVALDQADARADAAEWCADVYALFGRADPGGQPPHPYLWMKCARFLFRRSFRVEAVTAALPRGGSSFVGEAALLAMEYAPTIALDLFRQALRSPVPANRTTAAAVLALLDQPWSREELLSVLKESDEQERTSECRAALDTSRDPQARRAVAEWEERNPHEPEVGRFINVGEMMLRQRSDWVEAEMEHLRERVGLLAHWEPPK
jgi:hypothetical protein